MIIAAEPTTPFAIREAAYEKWDALTEEFLPTADDAGTWRRSVHSGEPLPSQGFKLHISATVLNAVDIFNVCAPYLRENNIFFKSVSHLSRLTQINMGLHFGFSQVGKFMTVYPPTTEAAVRVAADLHALTVDFETPKIPFDLAYQSGSAVHYRFGAFEELEVEDENGEAVPAIYGPDGQLVPDRREYGHTVPDWIENPFPQIEPPVVTKLGTQILAFEALSQRGKGGVYKAVDIRELPPRYCILKEGRSLGELDWDGVDGKRMVNRECQTLEEIADSGIDAPAVYGSFEAEENSYLVIEYVEGECLAMRLLNPRKKLPLNEALEFCLQAAEMVATIHASGWAWRDCKPLNMIVTPTNELRPVDFEGAVRLDAPSGTPYGTPAYSPPEIHEAFFMAYRDSDQTYCPETNATEDLYALGATIFHILTSFIPEIEKRPFEEGFAHIKFPPVGRKRKGVPEDVRSLITDLMHADPKQRPSASAAAARLGVACDGGGARSSKFS